MKSKWFEFKGQAIAMRKDGISMTVIERQLGIPRSTLSGWFKSVPLTERRRTRLMKNSRDGWAKARTRSAETHRAQKASRLLEAKTEATEVLGRVEITDDILDLAFAMLYLGEGAKGDITSLASSDPMILRFVLNVLKRNYQISRAMVRCDLHLRADQNPDELKEYWSQQLGIPIGNFRGTYFDKRTVGRPTYESYKGVCLLYCGSIAIQRKLKYLYNLFCEQVSQLDEGT